MEQEYANRITFKGKLIIDRDETMRDFQAVPEQTNEPDYEQAIKEVETLLAKVS